MTSDLPQNWSVTVDEWPLMSQPWSMLAITAVYLVFVLQLGPRVMACRSPFKLRTLLMLYNGVLVVFSLWWILKAIFELRLSSKLSCQSRNVANDQENYRMNSLVWYYLMSKFVELLDTVFFVLRKKQTQVSFLHVYHHTNMVIFTWAFLKYVRGDQILMIGCVNSAVHAVMYSYYFLAALGPKFQRLLWFKPYITWIQMVQFVFLICYLGQLLVFGCDTPRRFTQFAVVNTLSFLILFVNFYHKTYNRKKLKQ
ncbi:elongation of very long chain fatty acids protein 4-like isoform X2 [Macrosteles quadrilineatus]|uniref:elongation of very long chain fatty acids protein 4-like isoform X2 n=1 Tax=Macrosteles quadrilineatus TaxID=74068 RepID=UPI0023E173EA|nr:elongation of very long chain fatty acids protein 4-like isoform X2 [Macrosteles quadrilineatus]